MSNTLIITLALSLIILFISLLGFAVRVLAVKGAEFRGSCASANPMLTNEIGECQVCGAKPGDDCGNPDEFEQTKEA